MPDDWRVLLALIFVFGPLSLFSIGGGASLLAEIEHQAVARPPLDDATRIRRFVRDLARRTRPRHDAVGADRLEGRGLDRRA